MRAAAGVPYRGLHHVSRMDAAIDEAMECDRPDGDAAHPCCASFGGAAAPAECWGARLATAGSEAAADEAAVLRQMMDARRCHRSIQPWSITAAGIAQAADVVEQPRAGKHLQTAEGALKGSPA